MQRTPVFFLLSRKAVNGNMRHPIQIHLIDDDVGTIQAMTALLVASWYRVTSSSSGPDAIENLLADPPDVVVLDLMMPGIDGADLCRRIKAHPLLSHVRVIVLTAKRYPADRNAAMDAGADAFALKPIRLVQLEELIHRVLKDEVLVQFWGVRGTLPAPSPANQRYGGNTSCVMVEFPRGELFILDAGSGIREAGIALLARKKPRLRGTILITHPHWDHLNALPFFAPLYIPGNEFEVCGPAQAGVGVRELVAAQMDGRYFPITPGEFGGSVTYRDLQQGTHIIDGIEVRTMLLMHPGACLGYRLQYGGRSVAYITDNELYIPDAQNCADEYLNALAAFLTGVDLLITDTTYTDTEYPQRIGWGHSSVSQVARLAHTAGVKRLCLFHHDPQQTDADIDNKLQAMIDALAALGSAVACVAPAERDELRV